ncbi:MAG: radical SAM protein [Candidatus Aminicenantaceae bacterium]
MPARREFSLIVIPSTACNSSCLYCFQAKKNKKVLSGDEFRTILRKIVRYLKKKNIGRINFYWQGGEVMLLGTDYFSRIIEIQKEIFGSNKITFKNSLQSNMLSYDSRWGELITQHFGGVVGSSLDFPNIYRRIKPGRPETYQKTWRDKYMQAKSDGVQVNIITIPNTESFRTGPKAFLDYFLKDLKVSSIQINFYFPFNATGEIRKAMEDSLPTLNNFIKELFSYYLEIKKDHDFLINPFDYILTSLKEHGPRRRPCIFSQVCAETFMAVGPNGDTTLCDCWLEGDRKFIFGNLLTGKVEDIFKNSFKKSIYKRLDRIVNEFCHSCSYLHLCYGGCPVRTFSFHGDLFKKDFYCPVYKTMFEAASSSA